MAKNGIGSSPDRERPTAHRPGAALACVHVLGHPDKPLDFDAHPADAQILNCRNFCELLSRSRIPFIYYGISGSHVTGFGEFADLGPAAGNWSHNDDWHREYTRRLDAALAPRVTPHLGRPQVIAAVYGCAHADIKTPHEFDLPVVEPMVGYNHCWAPYRIFPSYAQQHAIYTAQAETVRESMWFDTVIPHFLDAEQYWIAPGSRDYALFLGRDAVDKGAHIAKYICERAGIPLQVVHNGVSGRRKTDLIARAVALFAPTLYVEPFGYVAVEAQLCGVPAITTDWGAFAETVEHGRTGFRCRTAAEFLVALERAPELDPVTIRNRAVRLYSIEAVTEAYLAYLDFVWQVHRNGGYYAAGAVRLPSSFGRPT